MGGLLARHSADPPAAASPSFPVLPVFAPSNQAFNAQVFAGRVTRQQLSDPAFLRGLLLASIVPRKLSAANLATAGPLTAADGRRLDVRAQSGGKRGCSRCVVARQAGGRLAALVGRVRCQPASSRRPARSPPAVSRRLQGRPSWEARGWSCLTFTHQTAFCTSQVRARCVQRRIICAACTPTVWLKRHSSLPPPLLQMALSRSRARLPRPQPRQRCQLLPQCLQPRRPSPRRPCRLPRLRLLLQRRCPRPRRHLSCLLHQ